MRVALENPSGATRFRYCALGELLARRFRVATKRLGLDAPARPLDTTRFRPPPRDGQPRLL